MRYGSEPLVSVITPAYNEGERGFIEQTLTSVSEQSYNNIEHIVVNDGSTDDTAQVVTEFSGAQEIRLISQKNIGQTIAVNNALEHSEGDIVIWLNADDVLPKVTTVSSIVSQFQASPNTDILYGDTVFFDGHGTVELISVPHPFANYRRLSCSNIGVIVFFDGDLIRSMKLNPRYNHVADYEICLRAAIRGAEISYVRGSIYGHRRHDNRKTEDIPAAMEAEVDELLSEFRIDRESVCQLPEKLKVLRDRALQCTGLLNVLDLYANKDTYVSCIDTGSVSDIVARQIGLR